MNTLQTNLLIENQSTKLLFRELFLFQLYFENTSNSFSQMDYELDEIIQTIDQLMELLIHFYDLEKD